MINFKQANNITKKLFTTQWVQWIHEGINEPANSSLEKHANVLIGALSKHCPICLNLNSCCFVEDKCPSVPLHQNCHCRIKYINSIETSARCLIEKFTKYVFVPAIKNDKNQLFMLWGFDIMDSEYLQKEFERQAKLAYMIGEYKLGKLDGYGQRINIEIKLKKKNKNEYVSFFSGWMIYPNGKIILTTPFGDK